MKQKASDSFCDTAVSVSRETISYHPHKESIMTRPTAVNIGLPVGIFPNAADLLRNLGQLFQITAMFQIRQLYSPCQRIRTGQAHIVHIHYERIFD